MGEAETTVATLDVEIGGLGGEVTLADLSPSPWVESHYEVASISGFLEESRFAAADQDSFESIPTHESDRHADASTEFDDWQVMLSVGVGRYVFEQGATGEAAADATDEAEMAEEGDSADAETEDSLEAGV